MLKALVAAIMALVAVTFGVNSPAAPHPASNGAPARVAAAAAREPQQLTIVNDYFAAPVKLVAGTRFETVDGSAFRSTEAVTVPDKQGRANGAVTVSVIPDIPGAFTSGTLTLPGLASSPTMHKHVFALALALPTAHAQTT